MAAACGNSGGSSGPDPFSVLPVQALSQPADYTSLPTPGGTNRADINPNADAARALGGSGATAGVAGDAALMASVTRFGVAQNIREDLVDALPRYQGEPGTSGYFFTFQEEALDAYAELDRFRALGVQTPSAPPE